jgi:hypothetical protein
MTRHILIALLGAVCVLGLWGSSLAAQSNARLTDADQSQIRQVVTELRRAIVAGDATAVGALISPRLGLTCTDTNYSHKQVLDFLSQKRSHLYQSLFDSAAFAKRCGSGYPDEYPAISDQEFLKTANEGFDVSPLDREWVEVTVRSTVAGHYKRVWSLHREAGTWRLAGSGLVIGNCGCG